jgi:predicted nucleic acid-binding protein
VHRALLPSGEQAVRRGLSALRRIETIRISAAVLETAGALQPAELRSLDALHLATALRLGEDLGRIVTYDDRLLEAARAAGLSVIAPR